MDTNLLTPSNQDFLNYLEKWLSGLPSLSIKQAAPQPQKTAIISVDMIKGFCNLGSLASPLINAIVPSIVQLLNAGWTYGIHHILFSQDAHDPQAAEFNAYAPHCIKGTPEAETIDELKALPFFNEVTILLKNSTSSNVNTGLQEWLTRRPQLDTFFVVGNCTDICVYQLAIFLQVDANTTQKERRIFIPADCVATYDLPLTVTQRQGGMPHPASLLHAIFLYHMALNGIEIVQSIRC